MELHDTPPPIKVQNSNKKSQKLFLISCIECSTFSKVRKFLSLHLEIISLNTCNADVFKLIVSTIQATIQYKHQAEQLCDFNQKALKGNPQHKGNQNERLRVLSFDIIRGYVVVSTRNI